MEIFLFINRHNQYGIFGIEQTFGEFEALFHEGKPLGVAVGVVAVYVVVVVFPVACASIVGWVDVDAIDFAGIEVFEQLQCVVVIRFNQGMPEVTVGGIAYRIDGFERRVNGFAELGDADEVSKWKGMGLVRGAMETDS